MSKHSTISIQDRIKKNKETFSYHKRFADLKGHYNTGSIDGDVFTLTRQKDNKVLRKFNVNTFLPVP